MKKLVFLFGHLKQLHSFLSASPRLLLQMKNQVKLLSYLIYVFPLCFLYFTILSITPSNCGCNPSIRKQAPLNYSIGCFCSAYFFQYDFPDVLKPIFVQILNLIREDSQPLLNTTTIMFAGSTYCTRVEVPTHQESVTFLITWPVSTEIVPAESRVNATLKSPSGYEVTPATIGPNIYHDKGLTYELYRITNPKAGNWSVNLFGVDLTHSGEEVEVNVSRIGPPVHNDDTPPLISISYPMAGKTYFNQLPTYFHFMIEDQESVIVSKRASLNGKPVNNNDLILLTHLGENALMVSATNEANLTTKETITFYVNEFSWLPPIKYQANSSTDTEPYGVGANSTIPIKFSIFDENNGFVVNSSVKVLVEGTTAEFISVYGNKATNIRINQKEDPYYIVNFRTNCKKWDYQVEVGAEYWIKIYLDDILAAKTRVRINRN